MPKSADITLAALHDAGGRMLVLYSPTFVPKLFIFVPSFICLPSQLLDIGFRRLVFLRQLALPLQPRLGIFIAETECP